MIQELLIDKIDAMMSANKRCYVVCYIKNKMDSINGMGSEDYILVHVLHAKRNMEHIKLSYGRSGAIMTEKCMRRLYGYELSDEQLKDKMVFEYAEEEWAVQKQKWMNLINNANNKTFIHKTEDELEQIKWDKETERVLLRNSTKYEAIVENKIKEKINRHVTKQKMIKILGHTYFVDLYLDEYKIAIEVDGNYHTSPKQLLKDKNRDINFELNLIRVFRISNNDTIDAQKLSDFVDSIKTYIDILNRKRKIRKTA